MNKLSRMFSKFTYAITEFPYLVAFDVIMFVVVVILSILFCGCGHNMLVENENIGFVCRVPVGEANYVGFAIGSTKSVVAAVRGGASFESTTSAGGGVFSGSGAENKITAFRSNLQFNEGNLAEAFVNPDIPMEVKLKLAEGVVEGAKAPKFPDAIVTTRDAVMQVGSEAVNSNAVSVAHLTPTGVDKVVDKTPEIVNSVTEPVKETVHDLVNPLEGTVSSVTNVIPVVNSVTNVVSSITNAVNDVKEVVEEVNVVVKNVDDVVDKVDDTAANTLDKTQKTIMVIAGSLAGAVCLIIIVLCISSLLRKKNTQVHKPHIGHHLDDDIPIDGSTSENGKTTKQTQQPEQPTLPLNWFQKLRLFVMKVVVFVAGLIGCIPASARAKAMEALREAWERRKAAKRK